MTNRNWLESLTRPQLQALASQRGVDGWKTLPSAKLVTYLVQFENIQEPIPA